jgi:ABC-type proline/glycine betaine transport system ATPase subunit
LKDAQTECTPEEFALVTERLSNDAAVTDVQMVLSKEEFALSMGQRAQGRSAELKIAQTLL